MTYIDDGTVEGDWEGGRAQLLVAALVTLLLLCTLALLFCLWITHQSEHYARTWLCRSDEGGCLDRRTCRSFALCVPLLWCARGSDEDEGGGGGAAAASGSGGGGGSGEDAAAGVVGGARCGAQMAAQTPPYEMQVRYSPPLAASEPPPLSDYAPARESVASSRISQIAA
eukprot:Rhum_TRINITY_DN21352_c0_g1::Rhum_TRINITY_DN21352_c0_g1_i1::g.173840::m.173840